MMELSPPPQGLPQAAPPPLAPHASANGPPSLPPAVPALPGPFPVAVSENDKTLAMLCHLLPIFTGFLGPLILWLVRKDQSPFVDHHGREALNFQITLFLVMVALGSATVVLLFVVIGILLIPVMLAASVLGLVAGILAAMAAARGEWHRYPCCILFF